MGSILVCLAGVITVRSVGTGNIGASLAGLYLIYAYWAPYMVSETFLAQSNSIFLQVSDLILGRFCSDGKPQVFSQLIMYANVGGTSKKVGVFGISYIGYAVGNLIGPQSFRATEAPNYHTAYTVMLVGYCCSIGLLALYGFLCWRDNKRKEIQEREWRAAGGDSEQDVAEEWKDLTDKQVSAPSQSGLVAAMRATLWS